MLQVQHRCAHSLPAAGRGATWHEKVSHRQCALLAGKAWGASEAPLQNGSGDVAIRQASVEDYFAIAEVHAQSFYPTANWFFGPLLRLDRVQALQVNHWLCACQKCQPCSIAFAFRSILAA